MSRRPSDQKFDNRVTKNLTEPVVQTEAQEAAGESNRVVGEATGDFPPEKSPETTGRSAMLVGTGILLSRIVGVIRQRVFAHYLGTSDAAGAFSAAFRIPNFLQNVFGEGALSASFIPSMRSSWPAVTRKKLLGLLMLF